MSAPPLPHRYTTDTHHRVIHLVELLAGAKVVVDETAIHAYAVDPDRRLISIRPDLDDAELVHALVVTSSAVLFGPDSVPGLERFPLRVILGGGSA